MTETTDRVASENPIGNLTGLTKYLRHDVLAGFSVLLIALPLCLGIANACGYPPIAGIFTAVIGGVLGTFLSNSELTIKGPAAGLIVIAIGCIKDFGGSDAFDVRSLTDMQAYRMALAVGVAAGVLQIVFAVFRTGILGEFFPISAVHGMLAAIGIIIFAKQYPVVLGTSNAGEPLELLRDIPHKFASMNPEIALIGAVSLLLLFGLPFIKINWVRRIPAPMVVVLVSVPLGMLFDLTHEHTYSFGDFSYSLGEQYLVPVPSSMISAITLPDFDALLEPRAWKWVIMFAVIGTLESMLSARAIDALDPWKRKTNLDRDNLAIGIGNTLAAFVGGLPMISEIVRSKANIDNGARTKFANLFHGLFLLIFVAAVPWLIHRIPLAALGAMLVYTGFRLASPREFAHMLQIGREQLLIFVGTIIGVLATDLLMGIGIGIAIKFLIHFINGVPLGSIFQPETSIQQVDDRTYVVTVRSSAIFSNWILLRRRLLLLDHNRDVVLNLSETLLVDHTVMEKLHELQKDFAQEKRNLKVDGLDAHQPFSHHPQAARRKAAPVDV